jgi:hypothetical protein
MTIHGRDLPSWGEEGLPLLPPDWFPYLPRESCGVTRLRTRKGPIHTLEAHELAQCVPWSGYNWKGSLLDLAVSVGTEAVPTLRSCGMLDGPVLEGSLRCPDELGRVPLLVDTWDLLLAEAGSPVDVAEACSALTVGELLELVDSLGAVLDVVLTCSSWLEPGPGDAALVAAPCAVADTLEEVLLLSGVRRLRALAAKPSDLDLSSSRTEAIVGRLGYSLRGELTLEQAGEVVGLTRERIRQITERYERFDVPARRWPRSPVLDELLADLQDQRGGSWSDVLAELHDRYGIDPASCSEVITLLGASHGSRLDLDVDLQGRLTEERGGVELPPGIDLAGTARLLWGASEKLGLMRRADARAAILDTHPQLDVEAVDTLIQWSCDIIDLPLDYVFVAPYRPPSVIQVALRMLSWAGGTLTVQELVRGINRRHRMRGLPPCPPDEVVLALYAQRDEFTVRGASVSANRVEPIDHGTVQGSIADQILESPYQALHRAVILDTCRQSGVNSTSAMMYLSFGEVLVPLGRGCFGVVGHDVDPVLLELAAEEASLVRVPTSVRAVTTESGVALEIFVGNALLDTGVVAVRRDVARRIGAGRYVLHSPLGQHGHCALSGSQLYGLTTTMGALDVQVGDNIVVDFDFSHHTARLRFHEPTPDPEPEDLS